MGFAPVTIEGRLGGDPVLRFIPSGAAVVDFSVAHTERKREGEQWVDGATLWFKVVAWRDLAERIAESLHRGNLVVVHGDLTEERYTNRDGVEKMAMKINAKWVGASLSRNMVTIHEAVRQQQPGQGPNDPWQQPGGWNPNAGQQQQPAAAPPAQDPWAGAPPYDEPPY